MPKQWDSRSLADLAEFRSGGTPSKAIPEYWGGPIPWVTVKDMKAMRFSGTAEQRRIAEVLRTCDEAIATISPAN